VSANEVSIAGLIVAAGDGIVRTNATVTDLTVRNVAGFGATFIDSITNWTRGRVEGCAGTGIYLSRSAHSWQGVTVANGRSASNSGAFVTGFGVIATESSSLDTTDLEIASIKGIGLFQSASRSQHLGARIVGNDSRGIWVQDSLATDSIDPELLLDQSVIMGNRGAGIQVLDGGGLVFQNGLIAGTRTAPVFGGLGGAGVVGDAIQLGGAGGIGNQLTTAGSVFLGNGRAGIAAENANSSLEPLGSDSLFICGQGETLPNWSCSETAEGEQQCIRTSGPLVEAGWSCADGASGTACTTTEAALLAATPQRIANSATGIADFCGDALTQVIDANRLVANAGLAVAGATPGWTPPVAAAYDWSCTTSAATRTCTENASDFDGQSLDNPTAVGGTGWSCEATDEGRRCTWSGFGVAAGEEVGGVADFAPKREPRIVNRDNLLRQGVINSVTFDVAPTRLPSLLSGARSVVGEDGLVGNDGALGTRAVVGEDGVVGEMSINPKIYHSGFI
jgi:hypothetical protein